MHNEAHVARSYSQNHDSYYYGPNPRHLAPEVAVGISLFLSETQSVGYLEIYIF